MSRNRVGNCKFYIDAVLLARQWGYVKNDYWASHFSNTFNLNPSNVEDVYVEQSGDGTSGRYAYRGVKFNDRYFVNAISHCFALGHKFNTGQIQLGVKTLLTSEDQEEAEAVTLLDQTDSNEDGWSLFEFDKNHADAKEILIILDNNLLGEDAEAFPDGPPNISFKIGDFSLGWSYEMAFSPDLELTLSYVNESIKTQNTIGGHTLTSSGYNQPPAWIRPAWSKGTDDTIDAGSKIFPVGRRRWSLKFSYLSDDDSTSLLFSTNQYDEYSMFFNENDGEGEEFFLKNDFMSRVFFGTNCWQLPFIFQPNTSDRDTFAICRVDANSVEFNQVANGVYDVSLSIVEQW